MNDSIPYVITAISVICGFLNSKSKIISTLQIFWIWILMAFNSGGMDWSVHYWLFEDSALGTVLLSPGWGYSNICNFCLKLGMEFYDMNFIVSTVILFVLFYFIMKLSEKPAFVLSMFTIFPLTDSIIQKRNLLGMMFLYIAFMVLIRRQEKKNKLLYLFFCLLAFSVHSIYIIYLPIVFLDKLSWNKIKWFVASVLGCSVIIVPVLPRLARIFMNNDKLLAYFINWKIPLYQSVCWWGLHISFCILIYLIIKYRLQPHDGLLVNYDFVLKINVFFLIVLPLYYYEPTFFRIYRNIFLLDYVAVSNCMGINGRFSKKCYFCIVLLIILVLLIFLSQFVWFGVGFDVLVKPLFDNNKFLN